MQTAVQLDSITAAPACCFASQRSIKNNLKKLTPSFNQHVVYKWLYTSVEREIGYIKVWARQPPSGPIWWNQLCCVWAETGQSSSTPNPWIKAKSYSRQICSAPGNPLWMWERTAQWVFRGRLGVLGLERERAGEDFISTVCAPYHFGKTGSSDFWKYRWHRRGRVCFFSTPGFGLLLSCQSSPSTKPKSPFRLWGFFLTLEGLVNLYRKVGVVFKSPWKQGGLGCVRILRGVVSQT